MFDLNACQLRITLEATEVIALEQYAGSSLRGALYEALLRRFCMNPTATSCAVCPLNATCPVAGLVAPLRDEHPRGRDTPRPFVIAAESALLGISGDGSPKGAQESRASDATDAIDAIGAGDEDTSAPMRARAHQEVQLEAGQTFTFAMTLFGRAIAYFPYLALSFSVLERRGMGRPLRAHRGRRGRPRLARIEAVQPFTGERETLFSAGEQVARAPTLLITPEVVAARALSLPTDRLVVDFATPMRLIVDKRVLIHPDARTLALRLVERLEALEQAYSDAISSGVEEHTAHAFRRERYLRVERQAREIQVVEDETRWVDITSYSTRQGRSMPIGGFIGQATLEGALEPLRELLVWGEVAHAGKNAVKGDGCFHLIPQSLAPALAIAALADGAPQGPLAS